jgi:hypothetical protein
LLDSSSCDHWWPLSVNAIKSTVFYPDASVTEVFLFSLNIWNILVETWNIMQGLQDLREIYLGFTIMLLLGEQALNLKCLCARHLWKISPLAFILKDWPQKKWSLQLKNSSEIFHLQNQRCMTLCWKHIRGILKATYLQGSSEPSHFYTLYVCFQSNNVGACSSSDNAC